MGLKPHFVSPIEALSTLAPGSKVFIGSSCGEPLSLTNTLANCWRELPHLHLIFLVHLSDYHFLAGLGRGMTATALGQVPRLPKDLPADAVEFFPTRYSQTPRLLKPGGGLALDALLVQVSTPDVHGYCSLGVTVGLARDLVEAIPLVIAEVNHNTPRTLGDSFVHVRDLDVLVESNLPLLPGAKSSIGEVEKSIARNVASLIPDGATIQIGVGAIPDAVIGALQDKNDLGFHSGLISDSVRLLIERGVITNARKPIDRGKSVMGEVVGSQSLFEWAHQNPSLSMRPVSYTHNLRVLSQIPSLVAINSAIQVDLSGQINAESLGPIQVSSVGGQFDFVEGASYSEGGISIIALPSTAGNGKYSRIVSQLTPGSIVTTPRYMIDYVVTEYGVAELRDKTLRERAKAMIGVAHPDFRDEFAVELRRNGS